VIALYEKPEQIGIYQVLNTYFILIHAMGHFILLPFLKNIYRLQLAAVDKIQRQLVWTAPFMVTASLAGLYLLLRLAYHITLDWWFYVIGFFITFPPYLYAVKILLLYRDNRQHLVFGWDCAPLPSALRLRSCCCVWAMGLRARCWHPPFHKFTLLINI
jgi:hypothetical protein